MKLKQYLRYLLFYNPEDRDTQTAKNWIKEAKKTIDQKPSTSAIGVLFNLPNEQTKNIKLKTLCKILDIIIFIPNKKITNKEIKKIFFVGNFDARDPIHNPEIKKLIFYAIDMMRNSSDPIHELSHILRAVRLAKLLYKRLKKKHPYLDWGIIACSLAWHDIYKAKHLGYLYAKNTRVRRLLRKINLLQDILIYAINKNDAISSSLLFLKKSRKKIPIDLRSKISIAILGEHTISSLQEKIYPGSLLYKKILLDIDSLEQTSIGRFETAFWHTIEKNMADIQLVNRVGILNGLFDVPRIQKRLSFPFSKKIFEIIKTTIYYHAAKFYPTDFKLIKSAYSKGEELANKCKRKRK